MVEAAELYTTNIDRSLAPATSRLQELENPSLAELAAQINGNHFFVIGPRAGLNPGLTPLEEISFASRLQGESTANVVRIIIGDEETGSKEEFIDKHLGFPELRAGSILAMIGGTDPELADSLYGPMARELFIARYMREDEHIVQMRTDKEVMESVTRLRAFAADSDEDDIYAASYSRLAGALLEERDQFAADSSQVIATEAQRRLTERIKSTRAMRWFTRGVGAVCLAATVPFFVATKPTSHISSGVSAEVEMLSADMDSAVSALEQLKARNPYTPRQVDSIDTTEQLLIADATRRSDGLETARSNSDERRLIVSLQQLGKLAEVAVADNNVTPKEEGQINQATASLTERATNNNGFLSVRLGLAAIFAGFGLLGFETASRNGGRRDPHIRRYRQGRLNPFEATASPAVNDREGLHGSMYRPN